MTLLLYFFFSLKWNNKEVQGPRVLGVYFPATSSSLHPSGKHNQKEQSAASDGQDPPSRLSFFQFFAAAGFTEHRVRSFLLRSPDFLPFHFTFSWRWRNTAGMHPRVFFC